jgi:MinD-like ATPase involved in chromosome partitioning or flagellar assembly
MTGRIVTFYAYKGGTGRSMMLSNVAWILASNGANVLAIDWDLEAPGLHRFFRPFLSDPDLLSWNGVIDFMMDSSFESAGSGRPAMSNLLSNARSLEWDFPGLGSIDFVPAGRQDSSYALRVNGFDWQKFYDQLGGRQLLDAARIDFRNNYDYTLIDSRTGVSDASGICTVQLPDDLVVCFTLNPQSLQGAASVAQSVKSQRSQETIRIFPVPTEIDSAEMDRLSLARSDALARFQPILAAQGLSPNYLAEVEVPYQPYFAFDEILAPFVDQPFHRGTILAAAETLTRYLTDGRISFLPQIPEAERLSIRDKFLSR